MLPIDSVTNREWSAENSMIILNKIRDEVTEELRARDATNGIPQVKDLFDEHGVKTGEGPNFQVYKDDGEGHFVIDPHLASLKHTGRESRLMVQRQWARFCSEKRDEIALTAEAGLTNRQRELARMLERTSEVEASDQPLGPEKSTPPETTTHDEAADVIPVSNLYACDECNRSFTQKGHLTNHKKKHAREKVGV